MARLLEKHLVRSCGACDEFAKFPAEPIGNALVNASITDVPHSLILNLNSLNSMLIEIERRPDPPTRALSFRVSVLFQRVDNITLKRKV